MAVSYPRRQQLRRLGRAWARAMAPAVTLAGALMLAWAGEAGLALPVAQLAVALAVDDGHPLRLAARSPLGAESGAQVRRVLEPLTREGWHIRHGAATDAQEESDPPAGSRLLSLPLRSGVPGRTARPQNRPRRSRRTRPPTRSLAFERESDGVCG